MSSDHEIKKDSGTIQVYFVQYPKDQFKKGKLKKLALFLQQQYDMRDPEYFAMQINFQNILRLGSKPINFFPSDLKLFYFTTASEITDYLLIFNIIVDLAWWW